MLHLLWRIHSVVNFLDEAGVYSLKRLSTGIFSYCVLWKRVRSLKSNPLIIQLIFEPVWPLVPVGSILASAKRAEYRSFSHTLSSWWRALAVAIGYPKSSHALTCLQFRDRSGFWEKLNTIWWEFSSREKTSMTMPLLSQLRTFFVAHYLSWIFLAAVEFSP